MLVTCHTQGCDNADITISLVLDDPVDAVLCGVCGSPIDDVVDVAPYDGGAPGDA